MIALAADPTVCPPMLSPRALTVPGIGGTWVVAKVRPRSEKDVAASLLEKGFDYFLPLRKRVRHYPNSHVKRIQFVPLGYLSGFVFCSSHDEVVSGYDVPTDLFYFLDEHTAVGSIVKVPAGAQERLVKELSDIHGDICRNPNWTGDAGELVVKGAKCRVRSGPFMGNEGVIDDTGQGWAILPITILGRAVPTRIPVEDLEPI
jgi:hypothetical protein